MELRQFTNKKKIKKSRKTQLSNAETKQATLDFIFGKSEENPIKI